MRYWISMVCMWTMFASSPQTAQSASVYVLTCDGLLHRGIPRGDRTASWHQIGGFIKLFDVSLDGVVYDLTCDGLLHRGIPKDDGQVEWTQVGGAITSFAVSPDRSVYALNRDGLLHRGVPMTDGQVKWTKVGGAITSFAVSPDGSVYDLNRDGLLHRGVPMTDGQVKWTKVGGAITSFAVSPGGSVYDLNRDGLLHRGIPKADGQVEWTQVGRAITSESNKGPVSVEQGQRQEPPSRVDGPELSQGRDWWQLKSEPDVEILPGVAAQPFAQRFWDSNKGPVICGWAAAKSAGFCIATGLVAKNNVPSFPDPKVRLVITFANGFIASVECDSALRDAWAECQKNLDSGGSSQGNSAPTVGGGNRGGDKKPDFKDEKPGSKGDGIKFTITPGGGPRGPRY
jgi:hypothetical protein